jgi:Cu2+-exporting ATPase
MNHTDHNHHTDHDHATHDKHEGHSPDMFRQKFWLSLVLTIPTLLFSHTVQGWFGIEWEFAGSQYIPAVFGFVLFFYGGMVFLKGARAELIDRQPGMMTLISMAIIVAFGYSTAVTVGLVGGMDFWWELATLITIMLLGHWMEMASVSNAQGALKELAKLLPDKAELISGETILVADLQVGNKVLVRPGGQVPADGKVVKGASDVNESMITGESRLIKKEQGAQVIAGTINTSGSLTIEVSKIGDDTALAGIMRLVAEAQSSRSRTQILADKAAFYLTIGALLAALVTWIGWLIAGAQTEFILERIVTVLVIACPHALGLAVPLVTAISTALAARNGLLVRQRTALETARSVDVVLFDKTGTLTEGNLGVVDVIAVDENVDVVLLAAAVEAESEHPIARAIVRHANEKGASKTVATNFVALAGLGAKAIIGSDEVYVGGPRLIEQQKIKLSAELREATKIASGEGKTVVYVLRAGVILGAIMLGDTIREESKEAVKSLRQAGVRVAMLTGDAKGVAAWVAKELEISEYFSEVLPEYKVNVVKRLQADGSKVAMVGDGVNDAPALTQADVGIAIGAGTDVAIESAGIVLVGSDPRGVLRIMALSKATYRKMFENLAWATGYNIIAIPLAAGVAVSAGFILSPAVGAVLMSLSTIIVAVNAQLLRRVDLDK